MYSTSNLKKPLRDQIQFCFQKYPPDIQLIFCAIQKFYLLEQTYFSNMFQPQQEIQQKYHAQTANNIKQNEFNFQHHLTYNDQKINKYICAKIVKPGQIVIQCLNCGIYDNAIICIDCFYNSNHKDHKYKTKKANGGCCDCGDLEVWRRQGFCKNHSGVKQQIILSEQQKNEFNRIWKHVFYWYFAMIIQYPNQSVSFGEQILKFLKKLTALNIRYIGLISNLFDQILQNDKFKLIDDMNKIPILEVVLKYVFDPNQIQNFCYLFITMFGNYQFRKTLTICFIKNYELLLKNQELRFWSLSCQLLTHEELILHVLEQGYLLVYKSLQGLSNIFMLSGYLYHSYKYITQSKNVALKYWKAHIESQYKITSTCLYIDYVEKNWKNNHDDCEMVHNFSQQTLHLQLIGKIANQIRTEKHLLEKCIFDLYQQIISKEVKNTYFLPYHRAFTIFLFTYFNFDITLHLDQKIKSLQKVLKKQRHEFDIQKLIQPIVRCLFQFLRMKNQSNYRNLYYNFWRNYSCSKSLDMILLKFCILIKPFNLFDNKIMVSQQFITLLTKNKQIKMTQIGLQTINKHVQFLSLLTELSISKIQELNIYCEISQTQNKYEDYAIDLLQRYVNEIKVCTHGDLESFNKQFLNDIINFLSIVKNFTKFDKITKKFTYTGKNLQKLLDIQYFVTKLKTANQIKSQKYIEKLDLTLTLNMNTLSVLNNFFSVELFTKIYTLIQNLLEFIKNSYEQNIFMKQAANSINYILKQSIKIYKIFHKSLLNHSQNNNFTESITKNKIHMIKNLMIEIKDFQKLRQQIKKYISEILIETQNQSQQKQMIIQAIQQENKKISKQSREQIKRKRIEQIKNKQKKFENFISANKNIQQQNKNQKDEQQQQICPICKRELFEQQCVFPAIIQNANLYQQSKLKAFEKLMMISGRDQKLQLLYMRLKKFENQNTVFTSCLHTFHLKCIQKQKKMSFCMICKRFYNILIPKFTKKSNPNLLHTFFTNIYLFSQNFLKQQFNQKQNYFLKLIQSFQQILGYIGSIDPQYFIKKFLKLYQQILYILQSKFLLFKQEQKSQIQKSIQAQSLSIQNDFNILDNLTNEIILKFIKNEKIQLQEAFLRRFSNNNNFNQQLIKRVYLLKLLTNPNNSNLKHFKADLQSLAQNKNNISQKISFQYKLQIEEIALRQLPTRYPPLNKYRINCPHCKEILRPGALCLLCEWQGCLKCPKQKLQMHCQNNHGNNCLFMILESTVVLVMSSQFTLQDKPIYQNQYGEPFKIFGQWQHFELDINKLNKLKRSISQYNLIAYMLYEAQSLMSNTPNSTNLFNSKNF